MYAHGGRTVELKGELAKARRNEELAKAQKAADAKALFALQVSQYSRLRRAVHRVQKTSAWGNTFIVAILLYAFMLAFYDPLQPEDVGGNAFISAADPVFTLIFTVDMAGGLIADGFQRFFSDAWNLMDAIIVGAGWVDFIPGMDAGAIKPLRMVRVLRPLRTLTKVESMRLVVSALIASIPGLANVLALSAFINFIFALFGLKLWIGYLRGRCFAEAEFLVCSVAACTCSELPRQEQLCVY